MVKLLGKVEKKGQSISLQAGAVGHEYQVSTETPWAYISKTCASQSEIGKPPPPTQFASNMFSQGGLMRENLSLSKYSKTFQEELILLPLAKQLFLPWVKSFYFPQNYSFLALQNQLYFNGVYAYTLMINWQCLAFKWTECSIGEFAVNCSRNIFTEMFCKT